MVVYLALAALIATVAFAAKPQTATAELDQLAASGISGNASFKQMPDGDVRVHLQLEGLAPGAEYESAVYLAALTCGSGTEVEIAQFTANNAGRANVNIIVPPSAAPAITGSAFISVEQGTTLLSCGEIVVQ
jgi:hypothetical protein